MGSASQSFNASANPGLAALDRFVDKYAEIETPTPDQRKELQRKLSDAGLFPRDRIDGQESELLNFSVTVLGDSDLAQRVAIGYGRIDTAKTTPDQQQLASIALQRLGYGGDVKTALSNYHRDYPLPVTERQIDLIETEVGGKIPLDAKDGRIIVRAEAVPDLVSAELGNLGDRLIAPLTSPEIALLIDRVQKDFSSVSAPIPQLKSEKAAELSARPPAERPVILRATPDQVSTGEFLGSRMQMRATWEAGNSAIEAAGGRVTAIDGSSAEGGKREIFTRDRFVMVGDKAYLPDIDYWSASDPEYAGYKSEIDQARTNLQQRGIQTIDVKGAWFEGGNIIQHMKSGTIFMGLAPDDDPQSAQKLITAINETQTDKRTMVAVPMTEFDPNGIYHLDLALSEPLANGKMLFDENITDDHTRARIEDIVGKDNIIPMTRDEAVMGSANILQVGNTAITTNISDRLKTELNKSGITTVSSADFADTGIKSIDDAIDRDGLGIGNGGIRCMGNQIGTEPRTDMNVAPRVALQMQPAA